MALNSIQIQGNLTRDIELRATQGGMEIGKFGLANNRKYKGKEETCFVDCTVFGKQAEVMSQYLSKGSSVLIEGRLQYSTWEGESGKRSKLEIVVEKFHFVGGKDDGAGRSQQSKPSGEWKGSDMPDVPF